MHVLLLTVGSHGDVQPFVALARALVAAGHGATVCAPNAFRAFIAGQRVRHAPMDDGFVNLVADLETRTAVEDMGSLFGAARTILRLLPRINPMQQRVFADAWAAAQAIRPDLLVVHPKIAIAADIADALGIPAVLAPLFPQFAPTAAFPAVGLPDLPLGDPWRRATYALVASIADRASRKPAQAWRRASGLGARPKGMTAIRRSAAVPLPLLHGFSPLLCPVPADWPAHAVAFGDWPLAHEGVFQPDPALQSFLAEGPPPVYFGFGSMAGRNPARKAAIVLEAVRLAGVRALIGRGWGGLAPEQLPPSVRAIGHAPHDWLFPQVAAVVHHGGAGTTHAGLRAGRPTIICPFFGDQPFWGRRVAALGAGPDPIPQSRLSADRLAATLRQVSTSVSMQQNAARLGEQLRAERGKEGAVQWLAQLKR